MKKLGFLILFGIAAFSVTYAVGFNVSVGFGGDFGLGFTSFNTNIPEPAKAEAEDVLKNEDWNRGGFWFYIDLTYLELNLGGKYYNITVDQLGLDYKETQSFFNVGLMVKYPFSANEKISLFPFVGFDWQIFTKVKMSQGSYSEEYSRSDLSDFDVDKNYYDRFVINFGFGADFFVWRGMYIRAILNYGINLHTKSQKDIIDLINDYGYDVSILNHGPSIKLAVGYRF